MRATNDAAHLSSKWIYWSEPIKTPRREPGRGHVGAVLVTTIVLSIAPVDKPRRNWLREEIFECP